MAVSVSGPTPAGSITNLRVHTRSIGGAAIEPPRGHPLTRMLGMKSRRLHATRLVLACALLPSLLTAQEWSRFRGPNGTGASEATTIPVKWNDGDINWRTQLPGIGHSSPIAWGNKLFLLSADPKTATLFIIDKFSIRYSINGLYISKTYRNYGKRY